MSRHLDFDFVHNIAPGRHLYQFYKNSEDYLRVLIPYFQAGLTKGEACLWLVSDKMGVEKMSDAADAQIKRYLYYVSAGQFQILSAEKWYLTDGRFDEAKAVRNASEALQSALKRGFHRLRGAGDVGAIPHTDWPLVRAYEKKMASFIKTSSLIALCAYPILGCTLPDTKAVLEAHDSVLVGRL